MAELGNLAKKSETDLGDPNDNECMDILATSEKKKKKCQDDLFQIRYTCKSTDPVFGILLRELEFLMMLLFVLLRHLYFL